LTGFLLLESAWAAVSLVAVVKQRAKANTHSKRRWLDPRVAALAQVIRRIQEHRANLNSQNLSYSANELRFELLKGLV
jgi:hypothetical protein